MSWPVGGAGARHKPPASLRLRRDQGLPGAGYHAEGGFGYNGVQMSVQVWKINAVKELRQEFSNAYLEIWNHGDNLKFLSFTGQQFTGGQIGAWLDSYEAAGQAGAIAYHYFRQNGQIRGIIVISQNNLEGFEILGLGVHPQTKNQGIGTALLRSALQSARDAGYRAISAKVFADNASMQRLLLREDFLPVAIDNAKRYDGMALVNYHKSFRE